jgi:hypothetical protein
MFTQGSGSVASYAAVAAVGAILSAAGTWGATQFVARSAAQPARRPLGCSSLNRSPISRAEKCA